MRINDEPSIISGLAARLLPRQPRARADFPCISSGAIYASKTLRRETILTKLFSCNQMRVSCGNTLALL